MKIGDSLITTINSGHPKSVRGQKASGGNETKDAGVKDSVDLSSSVPFAEATPVASYDEARGLLSGIDFKKAAAAHDISQETALDLSRLF